MREEKTTVTHRNSDASHIGLLSSAPLFSGLVAGTLRRLVKGAVALDAAPGTPLFRSGEPCNGLYIVVTGRVKLSLAAPGNAEKVIALVGRGETFEESAAFLDEPHVLSAEPVVNATIVHVSKAALLTSIEHDARFACRVVQALSWRLRELIAHVERSTTYSGTERVVEFLIRELPDRYARGGSTIALPAKKRIIASQLDLTHEHFSRILHDLVEARVLVVQGSKVTIPDVGKLRTYGKAPNAPRPAAQRT